MVALVSRLLSGHADVLQHWRRQLPTLQQRVKNFENWLLVELVHALFATGATEIKTNGYLPEWRPSYETRKHRFQALQTHLRQLELKGPKVSVKSISPDLSVLLPRSKAPVNLEIKTQTAAQEVLVDLAIAQYHNQHERRRAYQAGFLWVILEPQEALHRGRVRRSAARIQERAARQLGVQIETKEIRGAAGLRYALTVPRPDRDR
jgi:hypothetical protein